MVKSGSGSGSGSGGWWCSKKDIVAEDVSNPHAFPQEVIDARLVGWRVMIEQEQNKKLQSRNERMRVVESKFQEVCASPLDEFPALMEKATPRLVYEEEEMDFTEEEVVMTFE